MKMVLDNKAAKMIQVLEKQTDRFVNNRKGIHLITGPNFKYRKRIQIIKLKNGKTKKIEHYDLKGVNY